MKRYILPLPPSINRTYKIFRSRMYKSKEAHEYFDHVQLLLAKEKPSGAIMEAFLHIFFPTEAGDCDNRNKIIYDSCQGRLYVNDKQIKRQQAIVHKDKNNPRVELFLREISKDSSKTLYQKHLDQLM